MCNLNILRVPPQTGSSTRPAPVPPPPIKPVMKSDMDSDSDSDVPKEKLEKLKITPKSDHDEKVKKTSKNKSQNDEEEVDSEGYTVRRHRKSSSSSSSSWSSDDDGKPSHEKTYRIKVKIKDLDEIKPAQNQGKKSANIFCQKDLKILSLTLILELVKLSGPDLSAPVRSKPRLGRKAVPSPIPAPLIPSPTSTEPSVIEVPYVGCVLPIVIMSKFRIGQHRDQDYWEDAPHFTKYKAVGITLNLETTTG